MKIARVFIRQFYNYEVGHILDVFESSNHPGQLLLHFIKEVEVAGDFDIESATAIVDENGNVSFS